MGELPDSAYRKSLANAKFILHCGKSDNGTFSVIEGGCFTVPALSSVKIPVTEMIQEIIGRLIFMLDGGDFSPPKTFSGKLIRRDSLIALSR